MSTASPPPFRSVPPLAPAIPKVACAGSISERRYRRSSSSLPLHLPGGACGRPLGAVLEPLGDFRKWTHVDLRGPRPRKDAGDVEVGDRETIAEQVGAADEGTIEDPKRLSQLLFGAVRCRGIALVLGKDRPVEQRRQYRPL